jgi:hypothetical protein
MDSDNLEQKWVTAAMEAAGIDSAQWRPGRGLDDNKRTIQAVYDYYGQRFVTYRFLLWAGMANMIGATFYAAFMDLGMLPDAARRLVRILGRGWRALRREAGGELGFYETLFLTMQKKIFEDQASMHEAYLADGVEEIKRLYDAGIIDLVTFEAWQNIDRGREHGDQDGLRNGCRMLLWREQREIIDRFYVTMFSHGVVEGRAFTYAMSLAGAPSVPGARSLAEVFPLVLPPVSLPMPIRITTPLPHGNIAHFADRWRLIEADTLPVYLSDVQDDQSEVVASAKLPIAERAARYRLDRRAGPIVWDLLTRWGVSCPSDRVLAAAGGAGAQLTDGKPVVLDLRTPAAAETIGLESKQKNLVWTAPGRRAFAVKVRLPGDRVYKADAELVAAMSFPADGPTNHITVRLPVSDAEATQRRLADYQREWGIDPSRWTERAERLASSSDRMHGTQVLRTTVEFVKLEFEVAHHVGDKFFVISALFSW